jgi:hypothetical protein
MPVDVVEQRTQSRQLVRRADAITQRVGIGDGRTRFARSRVHRCEVLTRDGPGQHAAQGFASRALRSHAGAQRMSPAVRCDEAAALVPASGPRVARGLGRQRSHGSLMLESVAVLVGALAAGVVAIQARAARSAGDDELFGAPRTGAMRRADVVGVVGSRHVLVLRRGCDTPPGCGSAGRRLGDSTWPPLRTVPPPDESSVTKPTPTRFQRLPNRP